MERGRGARQGSYFFCGIFFHYLARLLMGCCFSTKVESNEITISLKGSSLNELPSTLFKQRNLQRLDISQNNLSILPAELGKTIRYSSFL